MEAATYRAIRLRVVLPLAGLIVLSSIDRVNISFAALRMNADLGMGPEAYGLAAGLFFVGYLLFQLPSAAVLARVGARAWIAGSVIGWGMAAAAMAFVTTPGQFYALRVLLGVFESGFAPGVVWYVSRWLPAEYRGRSVALTLLAIPTSVIVGGPVCGALLKLDIGMASWRFMFLAEGSVTILAGIAAWFWFVDGPAQARWLAPEERHAADDPREPESKATIAWTDPVLWLSAALWLTLITGANALIFWLPTAIKALGQADPLVVGVLSALPWLAIGTGMIANARHSDRTGERFGHVAVPMLLAAAGIAGAALLAGVPAMVVLMLGGLGLGAAQGVFWTIPTRWLSGRNPQAIALINLCGNASSVAAPPAIGWMVGATGSLAAPALVIAGVLVAGAALVLPLARACAATDGIATIAPSGPGPAGDR